MAAKKTPKFDVPRVVSGLRAQFAELGTRERARAEKAYLKSELDFHGVTVPVVRSAAREFCRENPGLTRPHLRALVSALFETRFHDLRSVGIAILECRADLLTTTDLPWLIELARTAANWAHVDWLATKVLGRALPTGTALGQLLTRWSRDPSLWVRRSALLAQHDSLRAGAGDFALFARIARPLVSEREFFIRKAIGWVLREVSKKRPNLSFEFLLAELGAVSGLTLREGAKYLSAAQRRKLGLAAPK